MTDQFPRVSKERISSIKDRAQKYHPDYALNGATVLDLLADLADIEAANAKLAEQLHYCNGTCELAIKHRDEAESALSDAKAEIERLDQTLTDTCAEAFNSQRERDERNKYYGRAIYDAGAKLCAIITEARKEGFKVTLDIGEGLMEPTVMHVVVDDPEKQ